MVKLTRVHNLAILKLATKSHECLVTLQFNYLFNLRGAGELPLSQHQLVLCPLSTLHDVKPSGGGVRNSSLFFEPHNPRQTYSTDAGWATRQHGERFRTTWAYVSRKSWIPPSGDGALGRFFHYKYDQFESQGHTPSRSGRSRFSH